VRRPFTPPVDGFWSLTIYNKEHFFEPNPLNRYSLGTKSKSMKLSDEGSLTLYVQNTSPGADKEANWLPAPKDVFSLYIRAYWPKRELIERQWTPPHVEKAKCLYSHARNPYSHPPGILILIAPESLFTCPGICNQENLLTPIGR
jgi:hypothetical protein